MVKEIWMAEVYFTDSSTYKSRPILVFKKYKDEDFLFLPLTTNLDAEGIKINNSDLLIGQIKSASVIIIPKISIIHNSLLIKNIGTLKDDVFNKVMENLCKEMDCIKPHGV